VVPSHWPQKPVPKLGRKDIQNQTTNYPGATKYDFDLIPFGPLDGKCVHPGCNGHVVYHTRNDRLKMILTDGLPRWVQGVGLKCQNNKDHSQFQSFRREYVETVSPEERERLSATVIGQAKGIDMKLIVRMRLGEPATKVSEAAHANLHRLWAARK